MESRYITAYYWSKRERFAGRKTLYIVNAGGRWYVNLKPVSEAEAVEAYNSLKADYAAARAQYSIEETAINKESAEALKAQLMRRYDKYTNMIDNFSQQCFAEQENREILQQIALIDEAIAA